MHRRQPHEWVRASALTAPQPTERSWFSIGSRWWQRTQWRSTSSSSAGGSCALGSTSAKPRGQCHDQSHLGGVRRCPLTSPSCDRQKASARRAPNAVRLLCQRLHQIGPSRLRGAGSEDQCHLYVRQWSRPGGERSSPNIPRANLGIPRPTGCPTRAECECHRRLSTKPSQRENACARWLLGLLR